MSHMLASAYDDSEYHELPPLRERVESIQNSFYEHVCEGWKKPPQKLSDDDIYELSEILDKLVRSLSERHKATPDMLIQFIESIFLGWSVHTATPAPSPLTGIPYGYLEYEECDIRLLNDGHDRPRGVGCHAVKVESVIRFNSETKSFELYIEITDHDGNRKIRPISSLEDFGEPWRTMRMLGELREQIMDELAYSSQYRAIDYARHYLYQTKTDEGQRSKLEYQFPQLSAVFAEAPLLLFGEEKTPKVFWTASVPRED